MSHPTANQPFPGPPQSPPRAGPSHPPRSGAHRPRRPLWHDILPAVVVLVAVAAVVFGIFQLKDSVLGSAGTSSNGPVDSGPQDPQASAPTAPVSTTPKASASSPSKAVTPSTPTVNRAVKVKVYNATSRTGLAKAAASKLSAANWNADSAGNQHGFSGSTTVYYTKASLRATAKAIAKDLGGYPARESTAYGSTGVIVILASDYSS
ncbi:MAG: LytR C-terminal domain-containing protein [Actinomycetota bacterium]|nr:LytR C-terminal domain-containing protein [Actinomycetota bacterium]